MDWRDSATCRGMDPDLFFPIGNSSTFATLVQIDEAKAVCGRCPVSQQCLTWALNAGSVEGVWGGTTEAERRSMRRRMARDQRRSGGTAA
ncbi:MULTISPECIES: WhiB family transcriptional regulator [Streptomyces]|uniref:WhiB family transcriptional regulator n=1 Tax=Streptomyces TaxID=1883 RepID=UPI0021089463|nr:WhiB family transcriptional regulator [Streptomyces longispororuber]MCQ4207672.1 WhiB family transcriptional regulator [Streptomyces longispororuber]